MPSIQTLTDNARTLSDSLDGWNTAYLICVFATVVLAAATFVAQFVAVAKGKRLSFVQSEIIMAKDAQLRTELGQKDLAITGLQGDVADAKSSQQKVEIELAKQQTKAAVAEKNLLELQERIKPRRLTDKQAKDFVDALKNLPGATVRVGWTIGGADEGFDFLKQLIPLFREAGWVVVNDGKDITEHFEIQVIGIGILVKHPIVPPGSAAPIELTPRLSALRSAFSAVGIDAPLLAWPDADATNPELVVGSKPQPKP